VKYRILAGAAASVALLASSAAAQVCQGDLSFRGRPTHITGAFGVTDHTTNFGGGLMFGHTQGLYGGGSLGLSDFDQLSGNAFVIGGGIGYAMPLVNRSVWQLCPGATLSFGFGPNQDLGGGNTLHLSEQTFTGGASIGRSLPVNKDFTLLPFGSIALGHTSVSASANGQSASQGDSYVLFGFGAGLQFSPNWVIKPAISVAAGADLIDDTTFGLSVSWALPR
jgi:opacity protein-like surface antigen